MFRRKEEQNPQISETKGASLENIQAVNSNEGETSRTPAMQAPAPAPVAQQQPASQPAVQQPVAPELRPSPKPHAAASRFERRVPRPLGAFEQPRASEEPARAPAPAFAAATEHAHTNKQRILTVGQDTVLKGEISTCDRLVVEGTVEAILSDVHTVEIAQTGAFKGSASVENAEISGLFDGDLEVSGRLVIYATGRVIGKVSYNEIEIERGGRLSGKVVMSGQAAEDDFGAEMKKAVFA